jgi:DnaK suppressor protein
MKDNGGSTVEEKDLDYFRQVLEQELALLLEKAEETVWELVGASADNESDPLDQATQESSQNNVFRMRSRESRLINKIRECLLAIESGTYGICEECEEPIAMERLKARPVTGYCITCKSRREAHEKAMGN